VCQVKICPWNLYFDGSVCSKGQGVGCVPISPHGATFELSIRLEFSCTNNQMEYEALLIGLEHLKDMGVKNVDAFGDSRLVVQQIKGEHQCLDGSLNDYRERCLDIAKTLDNFPISHVPRTKNQGANMLAQQASGYEVTRGMFIVKGKPIMQAPNIGDNRLTGMSKAGHYGIRRARLTFVQGVERDVSVIKNVMEVKEFGASIGVIAQDVSVREEARVQDRNKTDKGVGSHERVESGLIEGDSVK
jgi:ribonuclease HI